MENLTPAWAVAALIAASDTTPRIKYIVFMMSFVRKSF
jgi:hypothetical protein